MPAKKPTPPKPKPGYTKEGLAAVAKRNAPTKRANERAKKKGISAVQQMNWDKKTASTTGTRYHGRSASSTSNDVDMGTRYMGLSRANPSRGQDAQDMGRRASGMRRAAATKAKAAGAKNMAKRGAKRK